MQISPTGKRPPCPIRGCLSRRALPPTPGPSAPADHRSLPALRRRVDPVIDCWRWGRGLGHLSHRGNAGTYAIPTELPTLPMSQACHVRHDLDPVHHWLRNQITDARVSDGTETLRT